MLYLKSNGDPVLDRLQDSYINNKEWQLSKLYKGMIEGGE